MSSVSPPICPICDDVEPRERYRITRFRILECQRCAQIYLYPLPSPKEISELFAQLYTTGEGSVPELKSYYGFCYDPSPTNPLVELYDTWLQKVEALKPPGRILDVGCGTGLFLTVARRRGWEVFGIDDSVEATDYARQHFDIKPWVGDFADFTNEGNRFDVITGWDIIEHTRRPVELLRCMRESLAPGGLIALSTPNQKSILDLVAGAMYRLTGGAFTAPLEKFYIEQHFLYYTPDTLAQSLKLAGLDIVTMERELTDLRRLTLSPITRLGIQAMFVAARMMQLENRLFTIARASV